MILFNPSWKQLQSGLMTDDLIGQIRSFVDSEYHYQVLISEYIPNLRYFLHRYGLLECQYHSVFDELQGFLELEQTNIDLQDLNFPIGATFSYTPFNILVHLNDHLIGQICFGRGGETFVISEVQHFDEGKLIKSEIYDDRGFISCHKIYEEENLKYTEYLDISGKWIIREYKEDGSCEVNKKNSRGLRNTYYEALSAIEFELLETYCEKIVVDVDAIIVSVTDNNIHYIYRSPLISKMILSFFKNRFSFSEEETSLLKNISEFTKAMISDSPQILERLKSVNNKTYLLSPYDSRFKLSNTQEIKEEVVYADLREIKFEEITLFINSVVDSILYAFLSTEKDQQRLFQVILRVENEQKKSDLSKIIDSFFDEKFPKEMTLLKQIEEDTSENEFVEQYLKEVDAYTQLVYQLFKSFIIQEIKTEEELFELIGKTRLIIDIQNLPDLFTQIAGISAGIPQINCVPTEYVQHEKNGLILSEMNKLSEAIIYYLENLGEWQKARAYSVQQIKQYSGIELQKKILEIIRGKQNDHEN